MPLDWKNLRVKLLRGDTARWPAGRRQGPAWFLAQGSFHEFWFVSEGRGLLCSPRGNCLLERGVVLWLRDRTGCEVTQEPDNPLVVHHAQFEVSSTDGGGLPRDAMFPCEFYRVEPVDFFDAVFARVIGRLATRLRRDTSQEEERNAGIEAAHLLWSLLIAYDRGAPREATNVSGTLLRHRNRITSVIQEIVRNPREAARYGVRDLAGKHGYSVEHFIRIFRKFQNTSPKSFLLDVRFEEAKKLLESTGRSIEEIAIEIGYKNLFSFSREFKKRMGVSPSSHRRRHRIR